MSVFCDRALPALCDAAERLTDAVLVLHTDQADRIRKEAMGGLPIQSYYPIPGAGSATWAERLSQAHRHVLTLARGHDRVALLTADMVVSVEAFAACEHRFAQGKELIACCGIRALDDRSLPAPLTSRALLEWAWANRHPHTTESIFPHGCGDWSRMFFERDGNVICRLRWPHPLAAIPHGHSTRFHPTVDVSYMQNFNPSEIHVVTDPDELAVVELSPVDKTFARTTPLIHRIQDSTIRTMPHQLMQGWMLSHRIVIQGQEIDCGDAGLVRVITGQNNRRAYIESYHATRS